jgi:hypothetical protein
MDSDHIACEPNEYPSIQAAMARVDRAITGTKAGRASRATSRRRPTPRWEFRASSTCRPSGGVAARAPGLDQPAGRTSQPVGDPNLTDVGLAAAAAGARWALWASDRSARTARPWAATVGHPHVSDRLATRRTGARDPLRYFPPPGQTTALQRVAVVRRKKPTARPLAQSSHRLIVAAPAALTAVECEAVFQAVQPSPTA